MEHLSPQQAKKLLNQIPNKNKKEKLEIYQQVFSTPPYHNSLELDPDGAFHQEYTQLAERFGDSESVFAAWRDFLKLYERDTTNFDKVYNQAIKVFGQKQNPVSYLNLQLLKSGNLFHSGSVKEAVELIKLGLEKAKQLENKDLIFEYYFYMVGIVSENWKDRIRYAKEALRYVTPKNQERAWRLEGNIACQSFKYYEARDVFMKLEKWALHQQNKYLLQYSYMGMQRAISMGLADERLQKADYPELEQAMKEYVQKGITLAKEMGNLEYITQAYSRLANFYNNFEQPKEAIHHYELALQLAEQYGCRKDLEKDNYLHLYENSKLTGDFEKALQAFEKYTALKEEMYSVETQNKIAELNTTFEAEKREEEIVRLKKENELLDTIKAQKEELEQLNLTKDRIFAIIGHDMRRPVLAFRGIGKKINYLLKKQDYATLIRLGNEIEQEALALNQLTDNLLTWAILQKNMLSYRPQSVKIANIVSEISALFENTAKEKGIAISLSIPSQITAYADVNALYIIVRNLLGNAIKYTSKGDKVNITAKAHPQYTQLQITDTGVGIPQEKLKSIFRLQKDKSTVGTQGEKGTGLGLHLIHELVKLNSGRIKVNSKLEKGTTFKISLPTN